MRKIGLLFCVLFFGLVMVTAAMAEVQRDFQGVDILQSVISFDINRQEATAAEGVRFPVFNDTAVVVNYDQMTLENAAIFRATREKVITAAKEDRSPVFYYACMCMADESILTVNGYWPLL